jgi:hypothetical protein
VHLDRDIAHRPRHPAEQETLSNCPRGFFRRLRRFLAESAARTDEGPEQHAAKGSATKKQKAFKERYAIETDCVQRGNAETKPDDGSYPTSADGT